MTGSDSVIKVEADGDLTIQDRNTTTQHTFNPHCKYQFWYIDMWELDKDGSKLSPVELLQAVAVIRITAAVCLLPAVH